MMSRGPRVDGSNSTWARFVVKATMAFSTPSVDRSVLSMRCTHEEHVIPVT